ncbi:MAG: polynucleotide adenylyltransferase PcnB [Candidatus Hydrogenedentota bacterium]|nr:MAG: polynucleotide adenylyltransferase PcnB [Candidatus Hydrogenedentota bacterium]
MPRRRFFIFGSAKVTDPTSILRYPEGKRYYREFHNIRRGHIDPDALKVISRLQQFGYKAYLVGGSVRDLLLGIRPKDYDIVTNAKPNEIRKIFNNSRIIGKRFKIVHVIFRGNKIIEVATARSIPATRIQAKDEEGLYLKRDNIYGTFKEDAARRDFTINSLFYDVRNETILDYTGGLQDLQNKVIRVITTEKISFPEDPVRMLRAVKFAALLDFSLHPDLIKGIKKYRKLIRKAAVARLHEEINKIFRTGQSAKIFEMLVDTRLAEGLLPTIWQELKLKPGQFNKTKLANRLKIADRMIEEHEDINTNIYYALLLHDIMQKAFEKANISKGSKAERILKAKAILEKYGNELGLTKREIDRLAVMFAVQNQFRKNKENKSWIRKFKNEDFFLEAFILYKIIAISEKDEDAIQKALFWEIGLRQKLPDAIRKTWIRALPEINDAVATKYDKKLRTTKKRKSAIGIKKKN